MRHTRGDLYHGIENTVANTEHVAHDGKLGSNSLEKFTA